MTDPKDLPGKRDASAEQSEVDKVAESLEMALTELLNDLDQPNANPLAASFEEDPLSPAPAHAPASVPGEDSGAAQDVVPDAGFDALQDNLASQLAANIEEIQKAHEPQLDELQSYDQGTIGLRPQQPDALGGLHEINLDPDDLVRDLDKELAQDADQQTAFVGSAALSESQSDTELSTTPIPPDQEDGVVPRGVDIALSVSDLIGPGLSDQSQSQSQFDEPVGPGISANQPAPNEATPNEATLNEPTLNEPTPNQPSLDQPRQAEGDQVTPSDQSLLPDIDLALEELTEGLDLQPEGGEAAFAGDGSLINAAPEGGSLGSNDSELTPIDETALATSTGFDAGTPPVDDGPEPEEAQPALEEADVVSLNVAEPAMPLSSIMESPQEPTDAAESREPVEPTQPDTPTEFGERFEMRVPDDWHLHLRDGDLLSAVLPSTATVFGRAIIMPNLAPPIVTRSQAIAYRNRIRAALPEDSDFSPLMTLYLTEQTDPEDLARGYLSGDVLAAKLYPAGATTNSDSGVRDVAAIDPVLERMADIGMPLLVHGEVTDPDVDIFDREAVFIDRILTPLRQRHPELRVVLEHITTQEGADYVRSAPGPTAATITVHHLMINRNALFKGGVRPHYFCLPIAKREIHRKALVAAAVSGDERFFLGTDSAPHLATDKESACGCAGIFTAPVAIGCLAQVFEEAGALDKLEAFTSLYGAKFYRMAPSERKCTLVRSQTPLDLPTHLDFVPRRKVEIFDPERPIHWQVVPAAVEAFDFDFDLGALTQSA